MPHKLYGNRKPNPNTAVQVTVSTHYGRIEIAYLSLNLKNWRNGTSWQNATLIGTNIRDDITADEPSWCDYIIKSKGIVIARHDTRVLASNKLVTDYRNLLSEWNWPTYTEMRALDPTQRNHGKILQTYLERFYDYEVIPPSVDPHGNPVFVRKLFKRPDRSGLPSTIT